MAFMTVDGARCVRCGACVAVCPLRILASDETTRLPFAIDDRRAMCITCGHCVAVCPHGALSLETMPAGTCAELPVDWQIPPAQMEPFLKGRRSIRAYADKQVERKTIESLIDSARYAPSGVNRQPVYWAVVYEASKVKELAGAVAGWMAGLVAAHAPIAESLRFDALVKAWEKGNDRILRGAPHLVIAYGLKEDMTAPQAGTIALTYFELAALSYGLGTCWAGYAMMAINMDEAARKVVGLSPRTQALGALMLGYPRFSYRLIPTRNEPRIIWR